MLKLLETIVTIHGEILEVSDELCQVEAAQFNEDFGPWKAGEEVALLALEVHDAVFLREYTEDNLIIRQVRIQLGVAV